MTDPRAAPGRRIPAGAAARAGVVAATGSYGPAVPAAILDTGPLVALLDADEEHHDWAVETFRTLPAPLVTCEAVLAEAMYLLRRSPDAQDKILDWIGRGTLTVAFDLAADCAAVRRLMKKYRSVPMSLADACLVRMAETLERHAICTLDGDFRVYRKDGGEAIELVIPAAG